MEIKKQLSVFMENKPGNLAKFCTILQDANIDLLGISVTDAVDHAVIRVVVNEHEKCFHLLGDMGIVVIESDILLLELAHKPGELKKISQILSQESINIDYIYGSGIQNNGKAILFLKVSNAQKAFEMIKKYN
ncbi:MAG: ACT domain-containing protein [Spirochaetota bacterium]|nr:ACT domain-containing protein [Spirochaetota bacterium]